MIKPIKEFLDKELFEEDIKYIDPQYVVYIVEKCFEIYENEKKCLDLKGIDKIIDDLGTKYPRSKKALGEVVPMLMKSE